MTTERIDSTDGKITVFYRMTPWAWASLAWEIEIWHKDYGLICDQLIKGDSWKYDDFSAAWTVVYIGRQSADYYNQLEETDVYVDYSNYFKHNIQFAYNHAYNGSITVGVNNVFDADAPNFYTYADYRDVNVGLYDVLGRTYYLRINQKF